MSTNSLSNVTPPASFSTAGKGAVYDQIAFDGIGHRNADCRDGCAFFPVRIVIWAIVHRMTPCRADLWISKAVASIEE